MATITISGNDYFSYASVSQADIYLIPTSGFAVWDVLSNDVKGGFLITASRLLDQQEWKTDYNTQTLRLAVQNIVDASVLIAQLISTGDETILGTSPSEAENKRLKAGSVEIENFRSFSSASFTGSTKTQFPLAIQHLIGDCLASGIIIGGAASFGTDGLSTGDDDYGLID